MNQRSISPNLRRDTAGGFRCTLRGAAHRLFARASCDRYFGGLWFKVFSERGPC